MKKNKIFSLRWKIILIVVVGTLFFSAVTLIVTASYLNRMLTSSLIEQGKIIGFNVSELAAEKLIEDDIVALKAIIEKYRHYDNVEYIIIEDFSGEIKTDTYNKNIPKEIKSVQLSPEMNDNKPSVRYIDVKSQHIQVYDVFWPVKEGLLGFVRVGMRKSYVTENLKKSILNLGLFFIAGTFLAIILALFVITLQVTRPITYLTEQAYKISMGELDTPVRFSAKNEIGLLAEAIERMRESLKTAIARLRKK